MAGALHLRCEGWPLRLQRIGQQFEPVLAPKYFAVEHIGWRTEYIRRKRVLAVLLVLHANFLRRRAIHKFLTGQSCVVGQFHQHRCVCQVEFLLPNGRKCTLQKRIGIMTGFERGDHQTISEFGRRKASSSA